jgi:Protein of unknown function (DUF1566)
MLCLGMAAQALAHCRPNIIRTTSDSRFTVQPGGSEVLDNKTGLTLQRCVVGMSWNGTTCAGKPQRFNRVAAVEAGIAAGSGWRVPSQKELINILALACAAPEMNETIFPSLVGQYRLVRD